MQEFSKESDRASVILAAAMLEQELESLLRLRLVPSPNQEDALFDTPNAPISSFSAKIELAYRVGIISPRTARELHLVRRIRNDFAHNITGCTFENAAVQNRVVELVKSQGVVESFGDERGNFLSGPKGDFQMTVSWILWSLSGLSEDIIPLSTENDVLKYSDIPQKTPSEVSDTDNAG